MASDYLYGKLADALSRPSNAYLAAQEGLAIPGKVIEGYNTGAAFADALRKRRNERMTLQQILGHLPPGTEGYGNVTQEQFKPTAELLAGIGAIEKANTAHQGDYLSTDQAKQYGIPETFISTFKGNPVPRQVAQGFMANRARSEIAGALGKRTELQVANAINKNVNSLTSGTGALATAGKNNLRIARVTQLLQRPDALTPDELDLVKQDLTGVVQGGVPLKDSAEGQRVSTIATKFANLLKQASNQPQVFNDAGFRRRTIRLANEMIVADNEVQDRAFNSVKANYGHLTTPEHLERVRMAIKENMQLPIIDVQDLSSVGDDELRRIAGEQ